MSVRFLDGSEWMASRATEWNALLDDRAPESMFLTVEWYDAVRQAHAAGEPIRTVVLEQEGKAGAFWPLCFSRKRRARLVPWTVGADCGGWFIPHNGIAAGGEVARSVERMLGFLRNEGGWDSLRIDALISEGVWHRAYVDACRGLGLAFEVEPGMRSPYLPLEGSWEEYLASCDKKFRSDLKRCRRSMEQLGSLDLRRCTERDEVLAAYDDVLAIERQSWKHEAGSAITSRPWEATFYEKLLAGCADRGWIQISLILVDGTPVAHDIGMLFHDRYACLKTSFVEKFRGAHPGKVLRQFIIEGLYQRGFREHDFLGEDEPWKVQWAKSLRPHVNLTIHRRRWQAALIGKGRQLKRIVARRPTRT